VVGRETFWAISIVIAGLVATFSEALAGDLSGSVACDEPKTFCMLDGLGIKGEIDDAVATRLRRMLDEFDQKKTPLSDNLNNIITLDSPGGSVAAGIAIGKMLRKYRMVATVEPGAMCASSCVLIYAGAVVRRGYSKRAMIGIHQPFFQVPSGQVDPDTVRKAYTVMLASIRSYFSEMNVSPQLADEMLKTPAASVRYLSRKEQEGFGLSPVDPIERETISLTQAKELGLDRREYNRREALVIENCSRGPDFNSCHESILKSGKVPLPDLSRYGTPVE
jgi:ATP-dependent protease ClpP protease subunit